MRQSDLHVNITYQIKNIYLTGSSGSSGFTELTADLILRAANLGLYALTGIRGFEGGSLFSFFSVELAISVWSSNSSASNSSCEAEIACFSSSSSKNKLNDYDRSKYQKDHKSILSSSLYIF